MYNYSLCMNIIIILSYFVSHVKHKHHNWSFLLMYSYLLAMSNASMISGLSFEWTDGNFTSLQVSWDPVTAPQGRVTYRISYSPILANGTIAKVVVTNETEDLDILLTGLDPDLFYSVMVEAIIVQDAPQTSQGKYMYMKC